MAAVGREGEGEGEGGKALQAAEWKGLLDNMSSDALFVRLPLAKKHLALEARVVRCRDGGWEREWENEVGEGRGRVRGEYARRWNT